MSRSGDPYDHAPLATRATSRRMLAGGTAALLGVAGLSRLVTPAAAQDAATPAAGGDSCPTTTPEENIALVEGYWRDVWTAGGDAATAAYLAADEIHHWGVGGPTTGPDAFNERLRLFLAAFPDFAIRVEDEIADGDMVVTRYTATGTHEGAPWLGIEPAGTRVEYTGMNIFRIACGKIAESWGEANHLSLFRQLGGMPDAPAPDGTPTS